MFICQGSILGAYFDPQPCLNLSHVADFPAGQGFEHGPDCFYARKEPV